MSLSAKEKLTIPQLQKVAKRATEIRQGELRDLGVHDDKEITAGDVRCVLKAINALELEPNPYE